MKTRVALIIGVVTVAALAFIPGLAGYSKGHPGFVIGFVAAIVLICFDWAEAANQPAAKLKRGLMAALILGGVWEMKTAATSDRENLALQQKVADTELALGETQLKVELVRNANLKLLDTLKERRISQAQNATFMTLTEKIHKIPIKIVIFKEGHDTETFGADIRQMLSNAGFGTNSSNPVGIDREPSVVATRYFLSTNADDSSVTFLSYSTNNRARTPDVVLEKGPVFGAMPWARPRVEVPDEAVIYEALRLCFEKIGVSADVSGIPYYLKPGEFAILVRPRQVHGL